MSRKNLNTASGENTIIGSGTSIKGDISSDSNVIRIDGNIDGKVDSKGDIIVGEKGIINGDVTANSLILAGSINGDVNATHKITIEAGGKLIGNISTSLLAMDETAILQGQVKMEKENTEG